MNIQLAEEYKNAEKGEKEHGFWAVGAGARERKDIGARAREKEPGLKRGRTFGTGAREKESEPGPKRRGMQ